MAKIISVIEKNLVHVKNTLLEEVFKSGPDRFCNTDIQIIKDEIAHFLSLDNVARIRSFINGLVAAALDKNFNLFYIPAERMGINVCRGQLNINKNEIMDRVSEAIASDKRY